MDETGRRVVCVDLNGVLDTYHGWRDEAHWDPPTAEARSFLEGLVNAGFDVVVFTTRWAPDARRWLEEYGLLHLVTDVTDRKPPAHVFVDDRAVCFRGDYARTLADVIAFRAHWENP